MLILKLKQNHCQGVNRKNYQTGEQFFQKFLKGKGKGKFDQNYSILIKIFQPFRDAFRFSYVK